MGRTKGRKRVHKPLEQSEKGRGHGRERHSAPTLDAGPSIDAYLIARHGARPRVGVKMSAFLNDRDQDRAVAHAWSDTDAHTTQGRRTTMRSRTTGSLNNLTVRVAEATDGGIECYNAKLREVLVVVDDMGQSRETIVTAYPSDFYQT